MTRATGGVGVRPCYRGLVVFNVASLRRNASRLEQFWRGLIMDGVTSSE